MNDGYVKSEVNDGIATVTFHHPKSNSLPGHILRGMAEAISVVISRPCAPTPAFAIQLAMGEAATIALTGQWVYPRRAVDLGYEFKNARLVPALESILGQG